MTIKNLGEEISKWRLTRERITNLAVGLSALLIYEFLARPIYRPYIYKNNINDLHLADTIGNSLGTLAAVFVSMGFIGQGRTQHLSLIKIISISMVVYEIAQPLLGKPIDPWDIFATILTGALCFALYKLIHPKSLDKHKQQDS